MEERLMKRWGTLEQPNGGRPVQLNGIQRPVLDPWEKETERHQQPIVREFYDEDDEGFEIMEMEDGDDEGDWKDAEWEEEDGSPMKSPRMKISHLIAPKPAGGRGTFEPPATVQPSYFFNPNKQAAPPVALTTTTSTKDRNSKSEANSDTGTTTPTKIKRVQPPAAQPLLDEGGSELLLTVQEAQRRFESCSTDEAVEAMADEDEAPLVAYQQSAQLSWTNLGITSEILLKNLDAMSCSNPLVVQQKTIPHILTGSDVLVGMYTGSGKTLSFLTPLIQRLLWQDDDDDPGLTVIIVAPGRELASQIVSVARKLVEGTPYKVQLAIGGTTFGRNLEQIRKQKPNILVGTPGRIAELVVGKPGEK
jgi:primosomal protein N'